MSVGFSPDVSGNLNVGACITCQEPGPEVAEGRRSAYHALKAPVLQAPPSKNVPRRKSRGFNVDLNKVDYSELSVVIACYGQRDLTVDCVRTLRRDVPEAEIIIVDNGSPDDTVEWAKKQRVVLIEMGRNAGVSAAWNAGLRAARGKLLCVLNNDTIIHRNGMKTIAALAEHHGISSRIGGRFDNNFNWNGFTELVADSDYPNGDCLCFRRDVWNDVGEFDEEFEVAYCEDSDWGLRARSKGYDWEFFPQALEHLGGKTSMSMDLTTFVGRNLIRLHDRWSDTSAGKRIIVRRWGALGDIVMAIPVLQALRRKYPLARIYLECNPDGAEDLHDLDCVDMVHPEIRSCIPMSDARVIDLDGAYEERQVRGDWVHPTIAYAQRARVDVPLESKALPVCEELREWAAALLPAGPRYIACGVRSIHRSKVNWHEKGWLEMVREAPHLTFVPIDPEARPEIESMGQHRGRRFYDQKNVLDLTGETPSARHAMALLQRISELQGACVTVDSGILHLASGAGLPTVTLVGAGAAWARAPLTSKAWVFQGQAPCYPCQNVSVCSRRDGPHCLAHVSGTEVVRALKTLHGEYATIPLTLHDDSNRNEIFDAGRVYERTESSEMPSSGWPVFDALRQIPQKLWPQRFPALK